MGRLGGGAQSHKRVGEESRISEQMILVLVLVLRPSSHVRSVMPAWRVVLLRRTFGQCVAQLFKLLYRRFSTGAALDNLEAIMVYRRVRRLQIGDTAGYNPALPRGGSASCPGATFPIGLSPAIRLKELATKSRRHFASWCSSDNISDGEVHPFMCRPEFMRTPTASAWEICGGLFQWHFEFDHGSLSGG